MEAEIRANLLFVQKKRLIVEIPPHDPFTVHDLAQRFHRVGGGLMNEFAYRHQFGSRVATRVEINTLVANTSTEDLESHLKDFSFELDEKSYGCSLYDLYYVSDNCDAALSKVVERPNAVYVNRGSVLDPCRVDLIWQWPGWSVVMHGKPSLLKKGSKIITSLLY